MFARISKRLSPTRKPGCRGNSRCRLGLVLILGSFFAGSARAQDNRTLAEVLAQKSPIHELVTCDFAERDFSTPSQTPRLRMFGMPTGFLAAPFGIADDDDSALADDPTAAQLRDNDFKDVQIAFGSDNPYFDLMRPGNPGGIGYTRVYTQFQVFDSGQTSLCVNMLAYTPTGLENGGIANGPTIFCPAISWFHDLGQGTALQGFVCQNIHPSPGWEERWSRRMYYGTAWQCPLFGQDKDSHQGVFFFVQAMGRFYYDENSSTRPAMTILPGIHWRVSDNCWLSVGGTRHGIVSWAWQF